MVGKYSRLDPAGVGVVYISLITVMIVCDTEQCQHDMGRVCTDA